MVKLYVISHLKIICIVSCGRKLIFIDIKKHNNYFISHNFSANAKFHSFTSIVSSTQLLKVGLIWGCSLGFLSPPTHTECSIPVQDYLGCLYKLYSEPQQALEGDSLLTQYCYYYEKKCKQIVALNSQVNT